jgi:hypothetical protein
MTVAILILLSKNAFRIQLIFKEPQDVRFFKETAAAQNIALELAGPGIPGYGCPVYPQELGYLLNRKNPYVSKIFTHLTNLPLVVN